MNLESPAEAADASTGGLVVPDGALTLDSPVTGNVWKIQATIGQQLLAGSAAFILEAMKMEIPAEADTTLEVLEILVTEGAAVKAGQPLLIARPVC